MGQKCRRISKEIYILPTERRMRDTGFLGVRESYQQLTEKSLLVIEY
jgi:hypothetical protein